MSDIKSPDALELKGKPKLGSRFGKKAGFIVSTVIFTAIGLIMYGIATREPAGINGEGDTKAKSLTPASTAAKKLYEGVGDGFLGREENNPAAATAPDMAKPTSNEPGAPKLAPEPAPTVQSAPQVQTPEQQAAARLREQRDMERRKAIESGSGVAFGENQGSGGASGVPDTRPSNLEAYMKAKQVQGNRVPDAALAALRGGGLGGGNDDPNLQGRKEGFIAAAAEQQANESLRGTRRLASSAYELKASTIIPAVLLTGLNSDLPGEIIGQVSENVFDTATGRHLLVPQGSRVFGKYDSRVAYGQDRALVVWDRLLFPDGSSITLQGMGGTDKAGNAGFEDQVNNHVLRLLGYGAISSAFASVFQLSQRNNQNPAVNGVQSPAQVAAGEVARQYSQLGIQMAQKNLNIQPTIEIRSGYQFNVIVNRDMVFPEVFRDRAPSR